MDLNRNNAKARAWIELNWLPVGWYIMQDGTGRYVKVKDEMGAHRTICHAANWPCLVGYCEGMAAGRAYAEKNARPASKKGAYNHVPTK